MSQMRAGTLEAARDAIHRYAWREAFELLTEAADEAVLAPEDLEALGEAGWWVARVDVSIEAREKAFETYLNQGNRRRAAMVALAVAKDHFGKGAAAVGSAWVKRAERVLDEEPDCVERGWLTRMHGVMEFEGTRDFAAALDRAREALAIATAFQDKDLMAISIHDEGRALVAMGQVDEGWRLIDEATAAAVSGELTPYATGVVYCNTITACKQISDFRRAGEWSDAAKRWCERQSIAGFPGMCRVYRAGIMLVRGSWAEAQREARAACEELEGFNVSYAAEAHYELGEIRLRLGDLAAAEEAFKQAHRWGRDPQPGLAELRLKEGNAGAALSSLRRALEDITADVDRAHLLPTLVEVALAAGSVDEAAAAADELGVISDRFGTDVLRAEGLRARGRLHLHREQWQDAVRALRSSWRLWLAADAPYEAARTRVLIGRALRACGDEEDARLEMDAAAASFEDLGATIDLREMVDLLGDSPSRSSTSKASRTFLFTDIVRSTNLVEAIGDDAWHDVVRWHDHALRSLFAVHGGEEVDHAGDGFFVAFEDAVAAVECAVAIQRKLADHRREHGFAPQVRIGVHETEATRSAGGYQGKGVHEAARIASIAEAGEIIAGEATGRAAQRRFPISGTTERQLKGLDRPVSVVSIEWR